MKVTVGVVPTQLVSLTGQTTPVLQNLGPGIIYFDHDPAVTAATGLRLGVGDTYEFPRDLVVAGGLLYAVADVDTDLRILVVG